MMIFDRQFKIKHDEVIFQICPFCGDDWNFEVNRRTGKHHCWNCDAGGIDGWHFLVGLDIPVLADADMFEQPEDLIIVKDVWDGSIIGNQALAYLRRRKFSDEEIRRYVEGYVTADKYKERIIIPLYDLTRASCYFAARSFTGHPVKYMNPAYSKDYVFGFFDDEEPTDAVCVEGVTDAIAWKRIMPNVVVMLGKKLTTSQSEELISSFKKITVVYDSDAGIEVLRYWDRIRQRGLQVSLKRLPDKDADETSLNVLQELFDTGSILGELDLILRR